MIVYKTTNRNNEVCKMKRNEVKQVIREIVKEEFGTYDIEIPAKEIQMVISMSTKALTDAKKLVKSLKGIGDSEAVYEIVGPSTEMDHEAEKIVK